MYSLKDAWYLKVIVDCTKLSFDPCKKNYFFYRANTVQLNDYLSWIITVTNLEYLQIIRRGQGFDATKRYPKLLPRLNCGNSLAIHNDSESDDQLHKYPWLARICIYVSTSNDQTGTLISHRYVLTAAETLIHIGIYDAKKYSIPPNTISFIPCFFLLQYVR